MPLYRKKADGTLDLLKGGRRKPDGTTAPLVSDPADTAPGGGGITDTGTFGTAFKLATLTGGTLTGASGFSESSTYANGTSSLAVTTQNPPPGSSFSALCTVGGGGTGSNYARGQNVFSGLDVGIGDWVAVGMRYYLRPGYKANNPYSAILRFDNYEERHAKYGGSQADQFGINIEGRSYNNGHTGFGGVTLSAQQANVPGSPGRRILGGIATDAEATEGQWHRLELEARVHHTDGLAVNRVWHDDRLVLDNTKANVFADFVTRFSRCRHGIVAGGGGSSAIAMQVQYCYVATGGRLGIPA